MTDYLAVALAVLVSLLRFAISLVLIALLVSWVTGWQLPIG
jgi:hypothetical protein